MKKKPPVITKSPRRSAGGPGAPAHKERAGRLRAAQKMRDSEALFSKVFQASPIGINIFRLSDNCSYLVNEAFLQIVGHSREAVEGHSAAELNLFVDPETRDGWIQKLRQGAAVYNQDARIRHKSGEIRNVLASLEKVEINGEGMVMVVAVDVTERLRAEKALKASDDKFRDVFEAANVGKSITLPSGEISVNKAFADWLGYSQDQLAHQTWQALTPPEDIPSVQARLASLLRGDADSTRFAKRYIHKSGAYVWGDVSTVMHRDENGAPLYFITTIVDITERQQAEEKRRASEQRFAQAFYTSPAGLAISRVVDGQFVDVNEAFLRMFEFARDEVIGHTSTALNIWTPEARHAFIQRQQAAGGLKDFELQVRSKSGRAVTILLSTQPLELDGEPHIISTMIDISERKRAEDERLRLMRVLELSLNEIYIFDDTSLQFTYVNHGALTNLGYGLDELRRMTPLDLKPEFTEEMFTDLIRPLIDGEEDVRVFETIHRRKDGSRYPVEVHLQLVVTLAGSNFVAVIHDITERKRQETRNAQLTRMYATLSQVNQTIVRTRARQELFNSICEVAVEFGQFRLAWVGLLEADGGQVRCVAQAGESAEYALTTQINLHDPRLGKGPISQALRSGVMAIIHDIETDEQMIPWREKALGYGLRSAATVPVRQNGAVVGVLNLYSGEPSFFTPTEQSLLQEMGLDISFALDTLEMEARHQRAEGALRASEAALRQAQAVAHVGNWVWHTQENRLEWSDEMYRIFGIKPDTFTGSLSDVIARAIHPADREAVERANRSVIQDKTPAPLEYRIVWDDGTVRTVWAEAGELLVDETGRPLKLTGIVQDITERKKAEEKLHQSEQRFTHAFHASPAGMTITRIADGQFTDVNEAFLRMFEFTRAEVVGRTSTALNMWTPEERQTLIQKQIESGGLKDFEMQARSKSGQMISLLFSSRPIELEGEPHHITAMIDITRRKQAEEALRESEARYRNLLEAAPVGIAVHSEGKIVFTNAAGARLLGADSGAQLAGRPIASLIHPAGLLAAQTRIQQMLAGEPGLYPVEDTYLKLDGTPVNVEVMATALQYQGLPAVQLIVTDITERKRAEQTVRLQFERLHALRIIDQVISSSLDMRLTLNVLLEQVTSQLKVDTAVILLFDPYLQRLKFAAARGFQSRAIQHTQLRLGEGYAGRAALERRTVHIANVMEAGGDLARFLHLEHEPFVAYYGVPLIAKGAIKGVLEIFHRSALDPSPDWLDFLETLAGQAAIAVDDAQLFENLQRSNAELILAYDATIEGWSRAMDLRDRETEGHTQRVTELTVELARAAGIANEQLAHIRRGALLHDMGKLGVPDAILHKPGKLTEEEWVIMRQHPRYAYEMLLPIDYLRPALDIPYCHHEKWDGTGYPRGLKGEQIPVAARLFAVADVWDALRFDRPYRAGWPQAQVLDHIRAQAGTHFDPRAVELFLAVVKDKVQALNVGAT